MNRKAPGKDRGLFNSPLFKNKVFLIAAGSILVLAVALGVYGLFILNDTSADGPVTSGMEEEEGLDDDVEVVDVLPQQRRDNEETSGGRTSFDPLVDPFADPMRLTAIATGGRGGSMAVIESGNTSYMVGIGDYVEDLWAVRDITSDKAVLRAHNQEMKLYLDKPPEVRSLDPAIDENEREEEED